MFFLSHDDKYIIKTMRKVWMTSLRLDIRVAPLQASCAVPTAVAWLQGEVKLLLELLPRYCEHVEKHPHTLLIKFYGLHRVRPLKGAKVD